MSAEPERHYHVATKPPDCPHHSYAAREFCDGTSLGRGVGATYTTVWHTGPREACTMPDALDEAPARPCFRLCCEKVGHDFVRGRCTVCLMTPEGLEEERLEREREQHEEDRRHSVWEQYGRADLLEEVANLFDAHLVARPPKALLEALRDMVWDAGDEWGER